MRKGFFWLLISLTTWSCAVKKDHVELVEISTDKGKVLLYLYDDTPLHKDNFLNLVKKKTYNGTIFHRVIENFMIQGGDPTTKKKKTEVVPGEGGMDYTIPAEFKKSHVHLRGVLAAAREPDNVNPEKASNGAQFYIVQGQQLNDMMLNQIVNKISAQDTSFTISDSLRGIYLKTPGAPWLDGSYTIFGEVLKGMDVVDSIAAVSIIDKTRYRPVEDIKMKAKVVQMHKDSVKTWRSK